VAKYRAADLDQVFAAVTKQWDDITGAIQIKTPDRPLDILMNRWLPYQTLACRVWGRSGFYQASGAYGFRDQLQDVMALCVSRPELARPCTAGGGVPIPGGRRVALVAARYRPPTSASTANVGGIDIEPTGLMLSEEWPCFRGTHSSHFDPKGSSDRNREQAGARASWVRVERRARLDWSRGFDMAAIRRKTEPMTAIYDKSFPVCRLSWTKEERVTAVGCLGVIHDFVTLNELSDAPAARSQSC
jgi:hypothetical protein